MTFVNPAPGGGGYVTGDLIDESEINYWCSILPDCVDGAGGGTYTLSAPLVFEGDVVEVEDLDVTGDATVAGTLTVTSTATFNGNVALGNASGDTLTVAATSTFGSTATFNNLVTNGVTTLGSDTSDTLTVNADTTISAPVHITGSLTVDGQCILGDTASDSIYLRGLLTSNSGGRILETGIVTNNADQSIDIATYRNIYIPSSHSASHVYTLSCTGLNQGDWFVVSNLDDNSHDIAGLVNTTILSGSGVKYVYLSGAWRAMGLWDYLT